LAGVLSLGHCHRSGDEVFDGRRGVALFDDVAELLDGFKGEVMLMFTSVGGVDVETEISEVGIRGKR
jgi:hypothetical protein